ncbi:MAG: 4-hydroxythreonine-4-phosphate dehydrogenase PdxA [Ponticaulis sp.]|nr:4-hydroxythreonine-4-phosphate dehydrogenase PdxA [Ponticaulis sp.]|tara:strand:+ start:36561 stop:37565 length:1005 start_codon:yes stop_codon:yes gene_type:complete
MGDPAGVGPLASLLAYQSLVQQSEFTFYLRGSMRALNRAKEQASLDCEIEHIEHPSQAAGVFPTALPVIDLECPDVAAGMPDVRTAGAIISSIEMCVEDVWSGRASAVVTNPIAKSLLNRAGFAHPGHTEFLAALAGDHGNCAAPHPVMMLIGGGLRVALVTIHIPLMSVASRLTPELIEQTARIVLHALPRYFGAPDGRLGMCGLNPHAGEDGMLGSEDAEVIAPVIERLQSMGAKVVGPRPGDTIFHEMLSGHYDAVLAMYHDQGLIPVKTLDIWGGVNVTLGLPFIRTSPDHGTAYDAAAAGHAKPDSLIAAIRTARQMADSAAQFERTHD